MRRNSIFILSLLLAFFIIFPQLSKAATLNWSQSSTDGLSSVANVAFWSPVVFGDQLYVGTSNLLEAAEILRTSDLSTWTSVASNGVDNGMNLAVYSLVEFNSSLYASTYNSENGAYLYSSSDGENWAAVLTNGIDDGNNRAIYTIYEYNSYLYAGTWNTSTGGEVWRSSDGTNWSQVHIDGFGAPENVIITSMLEFNSYLYAGTYNNNGAQLWRSSDGSNWESVATGGINNVNNAAFYGLAEFNDKLYVGAENTTDGARAYLSTDGIIFSPISNNNFDASTNNVRSFHVSGDYLYTALDGSNGLLVYRIDTDDTWEVINTAGFGDSQNIKGSGFTEINGYLILTTIIDIAAAGVWYTDIQAPTVVVSPDSGNYKKKKNVTLTASDNHINSNLTIYYTKNGSDPTTASNAYSSAIALNTDKTLKFMAVDDNGNQSEVYSETYQFYPKKIKNVRLPKKKRKAKTVVVKWNSRNFADKYYVQLKTKKNKKIKIFKKKIKTNKKKIKKKWLKTNKAYKVRVRGIADNGLKGKWSKYKKFRTKPARVKNLRFNSESYVLRWKKVRGKGITYLIKVMDQNNKKIALYQTTKKQRAIPGVSGDSYKVKVRAKYNKKNKGAWSKIQTINF